jgi:hypothetical protein
MPDETDHEDWADKECEADEGVCCAGRSRRHVENKRNHHMRGEGAPRR